MAGYDPILLIGVVLLLSLAPFVIMMTTSYVKIVVVLSLVRNALGIQQVPPTMVLNGLAIILSIFIMAPVTYETYDLLEAKHLQEVPSSPSEFIKIAESVKGPFKRFLKKNAHEDTVEFFVLTARQIWPPDRAKNLMKDDFMVLVPAFTVSELTRAFEIGFLLYLPFIAIDLVVSNILLAMGMMMVSPMTISLPFKLLLFVLLNGWGKLIQGLILSYR